MKIGLLGFSTMAVLGPLFAAVVASAGPEPAAVPAEKAVVTLLDGSTVRLERVRLRYEWTRDVVLDLAAPGHQDEFPELFWAQAVGNRYRTFRYAPRPGDRLEAFYTEAQGEQLRLTRFELTGGETRTFAPFCDPLPRGFEFCLGRVLDASSTGPEDAAFLLRMDVLGDLQRDTGPLPRVVTLRPRAGELSVPKGSAETVQRIEWVK